MNGLRGDKIDLKRALSDLFFTAYIDILFKYVGCDIAVSFPFVFRENVCSSFHYVLESYRVAVQYTTSEEYKTCCADFIWCWDSCWRTR